MCAAETISGLRGTVQALPLDMLVDALKKYNRFD
jgi:hypothetical protein